MKKLLLVIFALFALHSYAGVSDLFNYNKSKVKAAFLSADLIDNYISKEHLNFEEFLSQMKLLNSVVTNREDGLNMAGDNANFNTWAYIIGLGSGIVVGTVGCFLTGIPFAFNLAGGLLGVLLVYLTMQDSVAVKSAAYGCATSLLLEGGCYLLTILGVITASAATNTY